MNHQFGITGERNEPIERDWHQIRANQSLRITEETIESWAMSINMDEWIKKIDLHAKRMSHANWITWSQIEPMAKSDTHEDRDKEADLHSQVIETSKRNLNGGERTRICEYHEARLSHRERITMNKSELHGGNYMEQDWAEEKNSKRFDWAIGEESQSTRSSQ